MKNIKFLFFALISILTLFACGDEEVDVTAPRMDIVAFSPEPEVATVCGTQEPGVFQLTGGDDLVFDVVFNDDKALSQYKIDIHTNFDCHGHGGGSAPSIAVPSVANQTMDWAILEIQELEGTSTPIERTLQVPTNVTTGLYHFQIQVIDESGNDEPEPTFYTLDIKNPIDNVAPQISIQSPPNNAFSVAKGDVIRFAGQVTDDRSLSDGGNGVLFLSRLDLSSGNTFTEGDAVFPFDASIDTVYDFDFEYEVPSTLVAGSYRYFIGANDGVRNVGEFVSFDVEVTN